MALEVGTAVENEPVVEYVMMRVIACAHHFGTAMDVHVRLVEGMKRIDFHENAESHHWFEEATVGHCHCSAEEMVAHTHAYINGPVQTFDFVIAHWVLIGCRNVEFVDYQLCEDQLASAE